MLEGFIPFSHEVSVIVARGIDGDLSTFPVCENLHANHILDLTIVPARISADVQEQAKRLAVTVAENRITSYNVCYTKLLRHEFLRPSRSVGKH